MGRNWSNNLNTGRWFVESLKLMASDWSILITRPEYWPLIGHNTGLWLVETLYFLLFQANSESSNCHEPSTTKKTGFCDNSDGLTEIRWILASDWSRYCPLIGQQSQHFLISGRSGLTISEMSFGKSVILSRNIPSSPWTQSSRGLWPSLWASSGKYWPLIGHDTGLWLVNTCWTFLFLIFSPLQFCRRVQIPAGEVQCWPPEADSGKYCEYWPLIGQYWSRDYIFSFSARHHPVWRLGESAQRSVYLAIQLQVQPDGGSLRRGLDRLVTKVNTELLIGQYWPLIGRDYNFSHFSSGLDFEKHSFQGIETSDFAEMLIRWILASDWSI